MGNIPTGSRDVGQVGVLHLISSPDYGFARHTVERHGTLFYSEQLRCDMLLFVLIPLHIVLVESNSPYRRRDADKRC